MDNEYFKKSVKERLGIDFDEIFKEEDQALPSVTHSRWTKEEEQLLRDLYPEMGRKAAEYLPARTEAAVASRAAKLGVHVNSTPYTSPLNQRYRTYCSRASMGLTEEQFDSISQKPCHYCGAPPDHEYSIGYVGNGLDRVDSSQGYTIDNVVPCCPACNSMKNDMDYDEFLAHVKRIVSHHFPTARG